MKDNCPICNRPDCPVPALSAQHAAELAEHMAIADEAGMQDAWGNDSHPVWPRYQVSHRKAVLSMTALRATEADCQVHAFDWREFALQLQDATRWREVAKGELPTAPVTKAADPYLVSFGGDYQMTAVWHHGEFFNPLQSFAMNPQPTHWLPIPPLEVKP